MPPHTKFIDALKLVRRFPAARPTNDLWNHVWGFRQESCTIWCCGVDCNVPEAHCNSYKHSIKCCPAASFGAGYNGARTTRSTNGAGYTAAMEAVRHTGFRIRGLAVHGLLSTTPAPCASHPCLNGGACLNGVPGQSEKYTCECAGTNFTGTRCQLGAGGGDECRGNPCLNGGTCSDGVGGRTCHCAAGYDGADCSNHVGTCAAANPCLNGGTCVDRL